MFELCCITPPKIAIWKEVCFYSFGFLLHWMATFSVPPYSLYGFLLRNSVVSHVTIREPIMPSPAQVQPAGTVHELGMIGPILHLATIVSSLLAMLWLFFANSGIAGVVDLFAGDSLDCRLFDVSGGLVDVCQFLAA